MFRHLLTSLLVAASLQGAGHRAAAPPVPDPRLTVADVISVTGIQGVRQVATGAVPGAGPGLNFASPAGMLLMVNFGTVQLYEHAKAQMSVKVMGKDMPIVLFHASVPGLGDEAFDSPPGAVQYVLYIKKGQKACSVTTYFNRDGKTTRLTMDQLKALATIVVGRM